jgi:hypothetical protein
MISSTRRTEQVDNARSSPLSCGYVLVRIDPCGLVALLPLTAR